MSLFLESNSSNALPSDYALKAEPSLISRIDGSHASEHSSSTPSPSIGKPLTNGQKCCVCDYSGNAVPEICYFSTGNTDHNYSNNDESAQLLQSKPIEKCFEENYNKNIGIYNKPTEFG